MKHVQTDGSDSADRKSIEELALKDRVRLLTGGGFWTTAECKQLNLKSAKLSDGPHGLRTQGNNGNHLGLGSSYPATCYPTASAAACSFNIKLCEEVGAHIGREAAFYDVAMVLGPGLNVKRSPLCGRNFEYFSEDGYLSGKLAAAYCRGMRQSGVTACVKHFAVNSREYARMYCDCRVDEGTLRETYLTGFEIAVKEGVAGAVMTAYNAVNGVFCNQNEHLVKEILRGEWGFDGIVISDWGGSRGRVPAVRAGADLEMPVCKLSAREVVQAVERGELSESEVNDCAERVVRFARGAKSNAPGSMQKSRKETLKSFTPEFKKAHDRFAGKVAEECLVLVKNDGCALPLKSGERVAVIGDFAKKPRYQGAGSSRINPTSLRDIWGAIGKTDLKIVGYARGFKRFGGASKGLIKAAVKLARRADTVLLCLGLDEKKESEAYDRNDLKIDENQIALLMALTALNKKVVAVLTAGSPLLTDWDEMCDALLLDRLCGQAGASAVVGVLTGRVNPSGKLPETYPLHGGDEPCAEVYASSPLKTDCAEGVYVGYKYYNTLGVPVKYPFGYGLSYTAFEFSDCQIGVDGVRVTVKNTGAVAGAEVVQVYVTAHGRNLVAPPAELKAFKKVYLQAGESERVFLPFDEYAFRFWSEGENGFVAGGKYGVAVGRDSAAALFKGEVEITSDNLPKGCALAAACDGGKKLTYEEYYLSHLTPDVDYPAPRKGMSATPEMRVKDIRYCKGLLAKIFGLVVRIASRNPMNANTFEWLSLRSLMQFMNLNERRADGFIMALNGRFFKGMALFMFGKSKYHK